MPVLYRSMLQENRSFDINNSLTRSYLSMLSQLHRLQPIELDDNSK
jgi:hypothetical protein